VSFEHTPAGARAAQSSWRELITCKLANMCESAADAVHVARISAIPSPCFEQTCTPLHVFVLQRKRVRRQLRGARYYTLIPQLCCTIHCGERRETCIHCIPSLCYLRLLAGKAPQIADICILTFFHEWFNLLFIFLLHIFSRRKDFSTRDGIQSIS
jgi:hypothetical protein